MFYEKEKEKEKEIRIDDILVSNDSYFFCHIVQCEIEC